MQTHQLHLYFGDGKGKTTAAVGLCLRALGHGQRVLFAQFMKNGDSGELALLRTLPNATLALASPIGKLTTQMNAAELAEAKSRQGTLLQTLGTMLADAPFDMIVLDELNVAIGAGLVAESSALALIRQALLGAEVVVTGRNPPASLLQSADYATEMGKRRHPFDSGLNAREGIEW